MTSRFPRASLILVITLAMMPYVCVAHSQEAIDPAAAITSGHFRDAEAIYRAKLKVSPLSAELLTNLGIAVQMQGRSSEAIAVFRKSLGIKLTAKTYALLAEEYCKTRDIGEAKPMLAKILREHSSDFAILPIVAPCYLEADEPVESVEVYQTLSSDPDFPRDLAYIQLAKSFVAVSQLFSQKLKDAPDGRDFLSALIATRDGSSNPRSGYGMAARTSSFFRPEADFNQSLTIWRQHSDDASLIYQMAVLSGESVIHYFQACEREFPQSLWLQRFRAEILASQGHQQEAVAILEKLIAADSHQPDMLYDLGMLYKQLGDWERMAETFRQLLALRPDDQRATGRLSEALLNLNQYDVMKSLLAPMVRKPSAPLWAVLDLATAEQKLGDLSSAIQVLIAGEKEYPSDKTIHYRLMRLYTQTGNDAAAEKERESFHRGNP